MRVNFGRDTTSVAKTLSRARSSVLETLFLATTFAFLVSLTACQRSGGQFFTPGLLIINGPAPDSKKPAGKKIKLSLEVTGDGVLKPSNTDAGSQLATAILGVEIYLVSREHNITISQGPQLMQGERGSSVKHMDFVIPECTAPGDYQVIFHELDRINGKEFYSVYSLPFHVLEAGEKDETKSVGAGERNKCADFPAPQAELQDSRPSKQPFIKKGQTGFKIQKGKIPLPEGEDTFVPEVVVTTLMVQAANTGTPTPPPKNEADVKKSKSPAEDTPAGKEPTPPKSPEPPVQETSPTQSSTSVVKDATPPTQDLTPPTQDPIRPPFQPANRVQEGSQSTNKDSGRSSGENKRTGFSSRITFKENASGRSANKSQLSTSSGIPTDSPALSPQTATNAIFDDDAKRSKATERPKTLPSATESKDLPTEAEELVSKQSPTPVESLNPPLNDSEASKQAVEHPAESSHTGTLDPAVVEAVESRGSMGKISQANAAVLGQKSSSSTPKQMVFSVPLIAPSRSDSNVLSTYSSKITFLLSLALYSIVTLLY
ncbi:hypothetical protein Pst134EA_015504 [Puccinia striiformis f. sp. tritici]|uniref:hypothetical protein n=1 Tax=Puccinia striiformis f. sp. tritici TaxID=168172 RepID=UPI002007E837|nr:hypothetical protein Pst134EA_015504 [Puccinia striiformis f. sp. tritici]KAH9452666.1 hypothetical protein Pst134EB_016619 [Puccinia striiformis f. sp. tritici]KAH9463420.1 hypothetical protein Pst134EA_015504 [Puccinia striiformis f. sp. tritici]